MLAFTNIRLLAVDIDGTLTDGSLLWGGPEIGWTQRYLVRDGEAILRLVRHGIPVVPLSRNPTACARARMVHLKLPTTWLGVKDKVLGLAEILAAYAVEADVVAYVGDGPEDADVFARVGLGCAVADAHPAAQDAAHLVLQKGGGSGAVAEFIERILA
jgi:3-deoxy-D-manno-octulosonate 8-phosphate phosphatase (KDO 8-P phosphatase)